MTTKLDPATITVDTILDAARRRNLWLSPRQFFRYDDVREFRLIGCCPLTLLAMEASQKPVRNSTEVVRILQLAGLTEGFRLGVLAGFDGDSRPNAGPGSHTGFRLGHACRLAVAAGSPGGEGGRA